MGANTFYQFGRGPTTKTAFVAARADALYTHGHGGYSGTLAEKAEYVDCGTAPTRDQAARQAEAMVAACDPRIDDKWGPAGAIAVEEGSRPNDRLFLFFGWASS